MARGRRVKGELTQSGKYPSAACAGLPKPLRKSIFDSTPTPGAVDGAMQTGNIKRSVLRRGGLGLPGGWSLPLL